jgi:prepilin-type N-terminal cleavage/methylation domain-containing protein
MLRAFYRKREGGFTLIELMIVVAIVGILAAIAVPNFIAYRNKSRIAASVGSIESIRAAIASYAADSVGNTFPNSTADITDYTSLVTLVNANGATLTMDPNAQGFDLRGYAAVDDDNDTVFENYSMSFTVSGIAAQAPGSVVCVSPGGINKYPNGCQ